MMHTDEIGADGFTTRVAEEVAALRYEDFTPEVLTRARQVLLDWLGAAIAGSVEPVGRIAQAVAEETGSQPVATIMGTKLRTSPRDAAMANAMAAHALDFDDSSFWMDGHPSAAVVSAAVALGEAKKLTTRQVVTAIIAGMQGQARIALATGPSAYENGFHGTGIYGTFGAAAACAYLLGLDVNGIERSLTLAATQAAGLRRTFGTMGKHLNAANAASGGLLAAQLAAKGFTAPTDGIEGRQGFVWTHSTTFDPSRPERVMGNRLAIESVLFKRHASCHGTHSTINGVVQLRTENGFAPDDVAGVRLFVPDKVTDICCIPDPVSGLEGKFSVRHAASVALAGRDTGPNGFTDASVHDERLIALRQLVTVVPEVERDMTAPTRVEITLRDGEVLEAEVDSYNPTADSGLGAEWEALKSKFLSLSNPVIGLSAASDLVGNIEGLDPDSTIGHLLNLEH